MKKLIPFLISGILVTGVFGCQEAPKTNSEVPANNSEASSVPAKPASETTQATGNATKSTTGTTTTKNTGDLKTQVTEQLQKALPGNKLEVQNKGSEIILKGVAASKEELTKAETLAKSVKGVKTVKVEATVTPAKKP
jgi:osmotically-inducible protein OsmY